MNRKSRDKLLFNVEQSFGCRINDFHTISWWFKQNIYCLLYYLRLSLPPSSPHAYFRHFVCTETVCTHIYTKCTHTYIYFDGDIIQRKRHSIKRCYSREPHPIYRASVCVQQCLCLHVMMNVYFKAFWWMWKCHTHSQSGAQLNCSK